MIRNSCFHAGLNLIQLAGTQAIACNHAGFMFAFYRHVLFSNKLSIAFTRFILVLHRIHVDFHSGFSCPYPLRF